jgi:predicted ATP-grasp superfamily ATP-dependent carboligase
VLEQLQRLGAVLADDFGLAGVVGVDLVLDDRVTVIEVNPRPSASAELIERATDVSIMATHLAAFGLRAPAAQPAPRRAAAIWSKAILFAASAVAIDAQLLDQARRLASHWSAADGWPAIADIPRSGQVLRAGAPVLTVFARGETSAESHDELRRRSAALTAIIG